ncbi:MAG TPA: hypothetical protein GXX75_19955 [Clostridiales bacterium]|nr:hypothetical protein [Clostridiales bacterium]
MGNYSFAGENRPMQILILSDRLMEQAKVLADFFNGLEDFHVIGIAENAPQALQLAENNRIDYLIISGYLRLEETYRVIAELQKWDKKLLTVHWAILDTLIDIFCHRYKIPLKFERTLPMEDFAGFLKEHRNDGLYKK